MFLKINLSHLEAVPRIRIMMSDYWIVVTMHPEDPMTGQFDKCFTRFHNSTALFSCPPPPQT